MHIFTRPTGTILDGATGVSPVYLAENTGGDARTPSKLRQQYTDPMVQATANFAALIDRDTPTPTFLSLKEVKAGYAKLQ
jgi:hypothetical protein